MINSRDVRDLHPCLKRGAEELTRRVAEKGYPLLITSTYRDGEAQNALYAQGRTTSGSIITNAKAGQSIHNYRLAFDICKNIKGHEYDDGSFFVAAGKLWQEMGGEWGGSWTSFPDRPHMQFTGGLTTTQLQAGQVLGWNAKMQWETASEPKANTVASAVTLAEQDLLCKLVHHEARGEDSYGMKCVVDVVRNRVKSKDFPDNIHDVIYQPEQFSCVTDLEFEATVPTLAVVTAVKQCLSSSADGAKGATYFCTPRALAVEGKFMANSVKDGRLVEVFRHGGHVFFRGCDE